MEPATTTQEGNMLGTNLAGIRSDLESRWEDTNGRYPQYAGWLATAVLVRVTKRVRTKGGLAFEKGQYALAWAREADDALPAGYTCHSLQLGWNVFLSNSVEVVA